MECEHAILGSIFSAFYKLVAGNRTILKITDITVAEPTVSRTVSADKKLA